MDRKIKTFIGFFILIAIVQILGSLATFSSVESWYPGLNKVSWNPPAWVFGPVWTILYIMIGISGWRVWLKLENNQMKNPAMRWYFFQLFINLLWSVLFFALKTPIAGFVDIIILIVAIAITLLKFRPIDKVSSTLLIPYFLWVCYAATLNAGIIYLN